MSDLTRVQEIARAALGSIEANRRRVDDLNVYPVPDGDTGTNLTATGRSIVEDLEASSAADRPESARVITRAALMGARGNSGVIFSQIVRGAADSLSSEEEVDERALASAFRSASDAAYRAVRKPVEGTMLSVIRELAEEAEARADEGLGLGGLLAALIRRGEDAVARTPEQLAVLRDAGVVDAGGAGLLEIVRGAAAGVTGEELRAVPTEAHEITSDAIHQELSRYRYCTTFVIEGDELDAEEIEAELERLGDSLLVVGDPSALKVHVHTDEPGRALSIGTGVGVIERVEIANMHEQTVEREARLLEAVPDLEPPVTEAVAVVAGDGNRRLFESLGATRVVAGGQSMNPSTAELVEAVDSASADGVILLPNNSNVLLTAEQAVELAGKQVRVVPTDSIQAGLAAMVAFDPERTPEENAAEMGEALAGVATGEVTVASRDVELNGLSIRKGAFLGLAGGEPIAGGSDFDDVVLAVVARLLDEPRDVLTLLIGEDRPELDDLLRLFGERYPALEVEVQEGGQPHYPLLLSAE